MYPRWTKGFLKLSESHNINVNEFYNFISLGRTARSVTYNLLHNPKWKKKERGKALPSNQP